MVDDVLLRIRAALPALDPAKHRVAEEIVEHPDLVAGGTITDLAERCETSQATVARLCKQLGFSGFRELRVALAAATGRERGLLERFELDGAEIGGTTADSVAAKVAFMESRAIQETADLLDRAALERAADAVAGADRIHLYGFGSSGLSAMDLQQKLERIGLAAGFWPDLHVALPAASLLGPGSAAIGLSHSGTTAETHELLTLARSTGATTIAITNAEGSPIASVAELVLITRARESRFRSGATASRIAQLAVIDMLFVLVLQRTAVDPVRALRSTYEAVAKHRLPYR